MEGDMIKNTGIKNKVSSPCYLDVMMKLLWHFYFILSSPRKGDINT